MQINAILSQEQDPGKSRQFNRFVRILLEFGISMILIIYLVRRIDFAHFTVIAKGTPLWFFLVAFVLYFLVNFFRALRFRVILDQKHLPLEILFPVVLFHNFFVRTLPFMTGEFSYVALLRRYLKQPVSEGISSLLGGRLFELLFVISGFTVGFLAIGRQWAASYPALSVLLPACVFITAGGIYFSGGVFKRVVQIWTYIGQIGPWRDLTLLDFVGPKLGEIVIHLERLRRLPLFLKMLGLSLCTYGFSLSFSLLLLEGSNIHQGIGASLVVISIVMIASWFPFTLSGFGIIEGSWAVCLVVFANVEVPQALSVGFFIHSCQVLMTTLSGMLGFFLLTRRNRTEAAIRPHKGEPS